MTSDFIDLHNSGIAIVEICGIVGIVAFLLGDMMGYARARRDRRRAYRLITRVVDAAQKGEDFDANNY